MFFLGQFKKGSVQHANPFEVERHVFATWPYQTNIQWNMHRQFFRLTGGGCGFLFECKIKGFALLIIGRGDLDPWRSRLFIPFEKLREVAPRSIGHAGHEIFNRCRLAIMALEVDVHGLAEGLVADERLHHAANFSALFVNRGRVEIVDLDIGVGPRRMGKGACIFRHLPRPQGLHIGNALHRARTQVRRKFLITEIP